MSLLLRILILLLALGAIFGRLLLPEQTLAGMDFLNLLYPQAVLVQHAYGSGAVPLWNWYEWGGSPLLAAMQSAALYPPMWLTLLFPLPYALQINLFAHLLLGALGAALFSRQALGVSWLSSLYAAIAYAGSGFMLGHIEQVNSVAAMVWAPWILASAVSFVLHGRQMGGFVACIALALLAGHPQHVVLAIVFLEMLLAVWLVALLVQGTKNAPLEQTSTQALPDGPQASESPFFQPDWRQALPRMLWLQAGIALAGLLTAAQLLPTQELSALSERVWPYPDPNAPALEWRFLPALVWPRFYNRLAGTEGQPVLYTELGLYCGLISIPLFGLGAWLCLRRRRSPLALALLVTWALSLLYALGKQGLLTALVFRLIPFLAHSRGAARSLNLETLLLASLAALGLEALLSSRRLQKASLAVALSILALLAADLALTHSRELSTLFVSREVLQAPLPTVKLLGQASPSPTRLYRFMANDSDFYLDHSPSAVYQRRVRLQPNLNVLHALTTTDGYEEGLLPTRPYANFLRRFNRNLRNDKLDAALLAIMGVNTVLTEYPLQDPGPLWRPLAPPVRLADNSYAFWQSAYESAWFLDAGVLAGSGVDAAAARRLWAEGSGTSKYWREPAGKLPVPHPYLALTTQALQRAAQSAQIKIIDRPPNGLRLSTLSAKPRSLLMLQSSYPGWRFRLERPEGSPEPLEALSPVFSGFSWPASPAGTQASLGFEPYSFRLGAFVTLLTLAALLGGWSWRRLGRKGIR